MGSRYSSRIGSLSNFISFKKELCFGFVCLFFFEHYSYKRSSDMKTKSVLNHKKSRRGILVDQVFQHLVDA